MTATPLPQRPMNYQARADAPNEFTPEPHFRPAEPDEVPDGPVAGPPVADTPNHGQTISAARNKGQQGRAMRALHANANANQTPGTPPNPTPPAPPDQANIPSNQGTARRRNA